MHAVDFLLDSIIAGFIIEFAVDTTKLYTVVEKYFLKGPRGRYIISLYTSINILFYDKGHDDHGDIQLKFPIRAWGNGGSIDKGLRYG
jgi:hypothetical protein